MSDDDLFEFESDDEELLDDEPSGDDGQPPAWLDTFRDERLLEIGSYTANAGGIVHLVGAGPGDPGLLTVRARQLLDRCDAVVHDALTHPAMLARSDASRAAAELHFVGKRGGDEGSTK